ncbi:hypothetical protein IWQ52_005002 [Labrenzia sp. EL_159]|nr:hypothetical protein [Labrenzia sp. EL_162]MBG6197455.1 hypothetical protein [Labrenzia sp. EL_159]
MWVGTLLATKVAKSTGAPVRDWQTPIVMHAKTLSEIDISPAQANSRQFRMPKTSRSWRQKP